jgi:TolB-like protein/class 3 adenylate cyclase/AraC-like DNA-binding protein
MSNQQKHRRLAAIMFTDIVGYTAMMQADEAAANAIRVRHRAVFEKNHDQYHGEILQYFGDGTLSLFQSGVEAVECAVAIQRDLNTGEPVPLRIGLHTGDIVFDGTEIYGDGVNLASRIESICVPGAILLSEKLDDELKNQHHISTQSLGHFEFKNIKKPVEVFCVNNEGINIPTAADLRSKQNKPGQSIVVLPFVNMSADPENEYFSDGITEEIINALTKIQGLKVIARTSAFAFKNKNMDVREIGRQLGVLTVLEGSIRKARSRVRITAQLINASDGIHFWSKNFDRELDDIFAMQDEISLLIADQIRENFGHFNVQEHLVDEQTKSAKAYELFLQGRFHQLKWHPDSLRIAVEHYDRSIQHDPLFARSFYGNVQCYGLMAASGFMPAEEGFEKAGQNFLIARDLDTQSAEYFMTIVGRSLWMDWDFQVAYDQLVQALASHPHHGDTLEAMAELMLAHGYFDRAEAHIRTALKVDPLSPNHHYTLGNIFYLQKKFEAATGHLEKALTLRPQFPLASALKAMCLMWLNQREAFDAAAKEMDNPKLPILLFDTINGSQETLPEELLCQWEGAVEDTQQLVPYELFILANSSHHQEALDLLKKYIQQKRLQIINFRQEPFLEKLRSAGEFHQFHVSNLQLPDQLPVSSSATIAGPKTDITELAAQKEKILQFFTAESPYLDPQLSLSSLAQAIDLHPNQLSLLINDIIGMNFNEFINSYRLEAFKQKALDPANSHLTLLGLAYESGFNSKTVFNAFFKKWEGMTPRAWVKAAKS